MANGKIVMDKDREDQGGSRPVPDPTALTTQQLIREMGGLRELLETRLDAMDKATDLNKSATDKVPCLISDAVKQLEKLQNEKFGEKFDSIDTQFRERDTRTEQTRTSDKVAVDAALQAQKEAAGAQNESNTAANAKTESNFTKQLDQTGTLITTTNKALQDQITEIKGRLDRGEGSMGGRIEKAEETRQTQGWVIPLVVVAGLTLVGIATTIIGLFMHAPK